MNKDQIHNLIISGQIRYRDIDYEKIKSMIESSENTMPVVKTIPLNENSATLIFRETYECIRQLGDAKWWLLGYEPRNHEVSMELLKELDIKEKVRLNYLLRFKQIRNDANYRGFKVSASQAKEILEFWDKCVRDMLIIIKKEMKL